MGRARIVTVSLVAASLASCSRAIPQISDEQIAATYWAGETRHVSGCGSEDEVIGLNRGMRVIVTHANAFECRDGPHFMIRYDVAPGPGCQAAGGVTQQLGFGGQYCEPAQLARKQEATRQAGWVCGFHQPDYAPSLPRPRAGESCPSYYARIFRETR